MLSELDADGDQQISDAEGRAYADAVLRNVVLQVDGKPLVAAHLVGNRGTVRHAAALGAIVTFTHTASVIVIGLLALFASQFVVPNVLVPILTILSGLLWV